MKYYLVLVSIGCLAMVVKVVSQAVRDSWKHRDRNEETSNMTYTSHWKKDIVSWASGCVKDIILKIHSTDLIHYAIQDDLRFHIGVLMGRIFELHRQQMDMYRRIKRRIDYKFNWIKHDLAHGRYENETYVEDYKPSVYITALQFITKRELDIEHLVKLVADLMGEEEIARFKEHQLPGHQDPDAVWNSYTKGRRQGEKPQAPLDSMEQKEKMLKQAMRKQYFDKYNKRKDNP